MAMQQHTSHAAAPRSAPQLIPMPAIMPLTPMTRPAKCSYAEFKEGIGAMEVDASLLTDLQKDYPTTLATAVARHVKRQQTAEHDPPLKVCISDGRVPGLRWEAVGLPQCGRDFCAVQARDEARARVVLGAPERRVAALAVRDDKAVRYEPRDIVRHSDGEVPQDSAAAPIRCVAGMISIKR